MSKRFGKKKSPTQKKKLAKSRRDEQVRKRKRIPPLCVVRGFAEYATERGWDDEKTDQAAWLMHRFFLLQRHRGRSRPDDWLPFPYQEFEGIYGDNYTKVRNTFLEDGFLEYNKPYGYYKGDHCSEFRFCKQLRSKKITASYYLKTEKYQDQYIRLKSRRPKTAKERKGRAEKIIRIAFTKKKSELSAEDCRWAKRNGVANYYELLNKKVLTEEQLTTLQRLIECTFKLKLDTKRIDLDELVENRHNPSKHHCDKSALKVKYMDLLEAVVDLKFRSIDQYGRYCPFHIKLAI